MTDAEMLPVLETQSPASVSTLPPVDPWAHRRGEPRLLAFFWTMYVLAAVAVLVTWAAQFPAISRDSFSPGARVMVVVLVIGATIMWPMVRLSQTPPLPKSKEGGPLMSTFIDALIVLIPLHLAVWPMRVLAGWPFGIVGGLAVCLSAWVMLIAGVLALAQSLLAPAYVAGKSVGPARTLWMLLIVAILLWSPMLLLLAGIRGVQPNPATGMFSPISAIFELTGRGRIGPQSPISGMSWRAIGLTWLAASGLWAMALVQTTFANRAERA